VLSVCLDLLMGIDAFLKTGFADDSALLVVLLKHFLYVVLIAEIYWFVFGSFG
jgi:hypothetical protein